MLIAMPRCDWKCPRELNCSQDICQNGELANKEDIVISEDDIIKRYLKNKLTKAIIFGGLEPFFDFYSMLGFIHEFRKISEDDIIIYTGYYENEIKHKVDFLKRYKNIIIKFGRFIPNQKPHYDEVLGVELISDNQYAKKIS